MTVAQLANFQRELAQAEKIAERRRIIAAAPEIPAEQILSGFKRELVPANVEGFGVVYYYHPLSIAEHFAVQSKLTEDGAMTAAGMVETLIALVRSSDGAPKFNDSHFKALMDAPTASVAALAKTVIRSHRVSMESVEKK
jgi:hypothetical protein